MLVNVTMKISANNTNRCKRNRLISNILEHLLTTKPYRLLTKKF